MNVNFDLPPALILGLIVSVVLPLLVGLVTTRVTASGTKAVLLAALASITGLGTELVNAVNTGTSYDLGTGIILALSSFLIAVGIHAGIYKPTGATAAVQSVGVTDKTE